MKILFDKNKFLRFYNMKQITKSKIIILPKGLGYLLGGGL